jgi:uncharacterized protein YjbI with pentapeptide repeats
MMFMAGYCFFCLVVLGQPDVALLSKDAEISVPFANTKISLVAFLIVGPFILVALATYLHIFIGQWLDYGGRDDPEALPFLFNMSNPVARVFTELLFYWLVPAVLAVFVWKALPRPEGWLIVAGTALVLAATLVVRIRRLQREWAGVLPIAVLYGLLFAVALGAGVSLGQKELRERLVWRPLDLEGADLRGRDLRGFNLRDADLREADLSEARLDGADLRGADLRLAKLDGARLRNVPLQGSRLEGASFVKTDLSGADLRQASLSLEFFGPESLNGADLSGLDLAGWSYPNGALEATKLSDANLSGADLRGSLLSDADLQGAVLDGAIFRRADLRGADLRRVRAETANFSAADLAGADLSRAFLAQAVFNGADMSGARLAGAHLRFAQLVGAHLEKANLRGAALSSADLRGADLHLVKAEGASLRYAKAQGARFELAHLEGTDLSRADLRGADFGYTLLILADLRGSKVAALTDAEMRELSSGIPWRDMSAARNAALAERLGDLDRAYLPPIRENAALAMTDPSGHYADWSRPAEPYFHSVLASCLAAVACEGPDEAEAVLQRLVGDWVQGHEQDLRPRLAQALLDQSCPVLEQMKPDFGAKLEALIAEVPMDRRRTVALNDAFTLPDSANRPAAGPCIAEE